MDTLTPLQPLCRLDEIPDGGAIAVDATLGSGEENLIALRQGAQAHVFLNICPHAGRQLDYAPGKFLLKNDTLICAVHGATFNKADGLCIAGPCKGQQLRRIDVQIIDGVVSLAG